MHGVLNFAPRLLHACLPISAVPPHCAVEYHSSCNFDALEIHGEKYCGEGTEFGPTGVQIGENDFLEWHSDGSAQFSGWYICGEQILSPPIAKLVVVKGAPCHSWSRLQL